MMRRGATTDPVGSQWRVFFRLTVTQVSNVLLGIAAALVAGRSLLRQDTLNSSDILLIFILTGLSAVLGTFAFISGRQLIIPIRRLITKTQGILHSSGLQETDEADDQLKDPQNEWSDLESTINEIRRDLQSKVEALLLEREQQATLMAAISDAILATDLEERPLFFNSRFAMLMGSVDLNKNLKLWQIFRDPELLSTFKDSVKTGQSFTLKAIPMHSGESRRFFSVSVAPLRDAKKNIYGAVGVFHDVTDLKLAEQMRIDFVANVSHELRTPLTSIKGYADTLTHDAQEGRPLQKEFMDIISRNVERLMSLIQDLLDLSALESTEIIQKSLINTREITERILQQLKGSTRSKGLTVEVIYQAETVYADPKRLEQVVVNLLDNAHKYTPEKGSITVTWEDQATSTALRIHNSGPGIPLEHQPRLFERFYRVDRARSRDMGGTGLGLAIVKHILQKHEGSVRVESRTGDGATFICVFPRGSAREV